MGPYVIGADIGSSAMKAALVHRDRGVVAISEQTYPMHRPHPGWAENDPMDWHRALSRAIPAVLAAARVSAGEVAAVCVVGQRDIAVLIDDDGEVLAPVIHWTDRRDPDETTALYERVGRQTMIDRCGTLPIPGLVMPNLVWQQRHQPDMWRRVRHALQPKDFLAYLLTDDIGTDPTGPTRSVLNDWRTDDWSAELCEAAGLDRALFPDVRYDPWEVRGELGRQAYDVGLLPGTLLVTGGGDDPAAALGSGVIDPGAVSIGTGSSMSWRTVSSTPHHDPTGRIGLMPHVVPDSYLHEIVAVGSGTTLRWFREAFGNNAPYNDLIADCVSVPPGSDGLLCFPYVEGATVPVQDDSVRAVYHGISGHHRRQHFVRATLEGIAYQYPALLQVIADLGLDANSFTISDGEARSDFWNQIKADVLGATIIPALRVEAPAIGGAILAGMGAGLFDSAAHGVATCVETAPVVEPDRDDTARYTDLRTHRETVRAQTFPSFR